MDTGTLLTGLLGSYVIEARHGEGTFGVTYRARDTQTGGTVIVKELRIERLDDWKSLELFEREGRALAALSHPSIPHFRDFFAHGAPEPLPVAAMGSYEGPARLSLVLVQEFIAGKTLQERVDQGITLTTEEVRGVLTTLLEALRHLHERTPPLIHRDIKPSNVILTPDGRPYLVDFGAIQDRLRGTGSVGSTIVGTLGYMPLEQTRGQARPASDLYALGVTMVVAMTGKPPEELPVDESTGKLAIGRVLPSGTPRAVHEAVDSMIHLLVAQRAGSAAEVLHRMQGHDAREREAEDRARRDAERAATYFKRGCDNGDAAGCARLGEAYEKGAGVTADRPRAVDLYRQACGDRDASACASLRRLHEAT